MSDQCDAIETMATFPAAEHHRHMTSTKLYNVWWQKWTICTSCYTATTPRPAVKQESNMPSQVHYATRCPLKKEQQKSTTRFSHQSSLKIKRQLHYITLHYIDLI